MLGEEIKVRIGILVIFEESGKEVLEGRKIKGFEERKGMIKNILDRIEMGLKSF